jgi:ankyrin repeat protein
MSPHEQLIRSAKQGNIWQFKHAIERGANIEYEGAAAKTALMYACEKGHVEIVKLLLSWGARVIYSDLSGNFPIDYARKGDNPEVIKLVEDACAGMLTSRIRLTTIPQVMATRGIS